MVGKVLLKEQRLACICITDCTKTHTAVAAFPKLPLLSLYIESEAMATALHPNDNNEWKIDGKQTGGHSTFSEIAQLYKTESTSIPTREE